MNDLDLCLEVASRSRQALRYIWLWISRKPLEIEAWFQRNTNRKWHIGYRMVAWPMTSRDFERSNSWLQCLERNISKSTWPRDFRFGRQLCIVSGTQIVFPENGSGLGHVTLQFLPYNPAYLQNYLSYILQIWYTALYGQCRAGTRIISLKVGVA